MRKDFFPDRDGEVVTWSQNFLRRLTEQPGHFGVPEQDVQDYAQLHEAFMVKYLANASPEARSKVTALGKQMAKKALEAAARRLSRLIHGTAGVSDVQKALLGLSVRGAGGNQSLTGAPTTRPRLIVQSVEGRRVTLYIGDSESSRRARPRGVAGAAIYTWDEAGAPPAELHKWRLRGYATKPQFTIQFDPDVAAGTKVYFLAHWLSTRLEPGPLSQIIHTRLQWSDAPVIVHLNVRRRAA